MLNQTIQYFLKTYNTDFDNITITFTDQNCRLLDIEDKLNFTLLIKKIEMTRYSIEPKTRKYFKRCGFLLFGRKSSNMYGKKVLKAATKTGLDGLKTATKIVAHKGGEFIRNKITKKIIGPKPLPDDDL